MVILLNVVIPFILIMGLAASIMYFMDTLSRPYQDKQDGE